MTASKTERRFLSEGVVGGSRERSICVAFLIAVVLAIAACTSSDDVEMLGDENSELRTELAALQDQVDEQAEKLEAAGDDLVDLRSEVSSTKQCASALRGTVAKLSSGVQQVANPNDSTLPSVGLDAQPCRAAMSGNAATAIRAAVGTADRALKQVEQQRKDGGQDPPVNGCDPNYSGYCVPLVSYDLDCDDVGSFFRVEGIDKHGFDGDNDGIACES